MATEIEIKEDNNIQAEVIPLPSESTITIPPENQIIINDDDIQLLPCKYYIGIYISAFLGLVALVLYTIFHKDENNEDIETTRLIYKKLFIYLTILGLTGFNGYVLRNYLKWKVNYTRKINHIFVWSVPFIADAIVDIEESTVSLLWNVYFAALGLVLWMKPSRNADCTGFLDVSYSSVDRPEDRPNTLKWMTWQNVGVGLSVIPFGFLWEFWGIDSFVVIPIMIVTFGDGLAEPVGVKFGKHKYKVKGIGTNQIYTRSLEGSAMVFIASIIVIAILYNDFTKTEFIANICIIPFIATLCEAISPHTLDNPILIITISMIISLIHLIAVEI